MCRLCPNRPTGTEGRQGHMDVPTQVIRTAHWYDSAPRLGYRILNAAKYKVGHPTGTSKIEGHVADVSHLALYGFMVGMPVTGTIMGYYGGKGLPFFWTTLDGATTANGKLAGQAYSIHKTMGTYGKFLIPLHIGGAVKHSLTGNAIWSRINPFGRPMH